MGSQVRRRIGEILIADYHVLAEDVAEALRAQTQGQPDRVGRYLVRRGILSERDLATALGHQLGVPVLLGLPRLEVPPEVLQLVPLRSAERKLVIPVSVVGRELVLAMADPTDGAIVEVLEEKTGLSIRPAIATEEEIRIALKVFFLDDHSHADPLELSDTFESLRHRMHAAMSPSPAPVLPISPETGGSTVGA